MQMSTTTITPEKQTEYKNRLNYFLLEQLKDEAQGAEHYFKKAKLAHEIGDSQLFTMLISHSKDEIKHFKELHSSIERSIAELKANPLYPLLETLEDWVEEIEEQIIHFGR